MICCSQSSTTLLHTQTQPIQHAAHTSQIHLFCVLLIILWCDFGTRVHMTSFSNMETVRQMVLLQQNLDVAVLQTMKLEKSIHTWRQKMAHLWTVYACRQSVIGHASISPPFRGWRLLLLPGVSLIMTVLPIFASRCTQSLRNFDIARIIGNWTFGHSESTHLGVKPSEYQIMSYNTGEYFWCTDKLGITNYWTILASAQCMRIPNNMNSCIKMLVLYLLIFLNTPYLTIHVNISQYMGFLLGFNLNDHVSYVSYYYLLYY